MKTTAPTLLLIVLLPASGVFGWPIQRKSLRELVVHSELIVTARIGKTRVVVKEDRERYVDEISCTNLTVEKKVLGNHDGEEIKVYFNSSVLCPRPPYFPEGK